MLFIRMLKKKSVIFTALVFMFVLGNITSASGNAILEKISAYLDHGIKLNLEGEELSPQDAKGNVVVPISYNGTTYLPLRSLSQAVGLDVKWDETSKTVFLSHSIPNNSDAQGILLSEDKTIQYTFPKEWSNWAGAKKINPQSILSAWSRNKFMLTIRESKANFKEGSTLRNYADLIIQQTTTNMNNATVISTTDLMIDGKNAKQYEISGTVSSFKVIYMITVIESEKSFYVIFQWCGLEDYADTKDVFKSITSSFKEITTS